MAKKELSVAVVMHNPDGDGQDALYIDGKLIMQGDEYHDKIGNSITEFLSGAKWAGAVLGKRKNYWTGATGDDAYEFYDFPKEFNSKWKVRK